jgi:hypothetical protein
MPVVTGKLWTQEEIVKLIEKNNLFVESCIIKIFERQTADEQENSTTEHNNGIGFSGVDAKTMTYYAKYIKSGRHLTGEHLEKARQRIKKYKRQLTEIANNSTSEKAAV